MTFLRTVLGKFLLLPTIVAVIGEQRDDLTRADARITELEHTVLALEGRISSIQARMPNRRSVDRSLLP